MKLVIEMLRISNISEGLTKKIRENLVVDDTRAEQIEYGIYMAISELVKLGAILILSAIFNLLVYALAAIVIFGVHRNFIGGVHAKTHWGCFLSYSVIVFGPILASTHIHVSPVWLLSIYPVCLWIGYLYAPADIFNKPVLSMKQRSSLRRNGFIFLTLVFAAVLAVPWPYSNILAIITLVEYTTILPVVYKITGNEYGKKEVKKHEA